MAGFAVAGVPSATFRQASTNTAAGLTAAKLVSSDGVRAKRVVVAVEVNSVRVAWSATPTQGASPLGVLLNNGDVLTLESPAAAERLKVISAVADTHGVLQVSVEF